MRLACAARRARQPCRCSRVARCGAAARRGWLPSGAGCSATGWRWRRRHPGTRVKPAQASATWAMLSVRSSAAIGAGTRSAFVPARLLWFAIRVNQVDAVHENRGRGLPPPRSRERTNAPPKQRASGFRLQNSNLCALLASGSLPCASSARFGLQPACKRPAKGVRRGVSAPAPPASSDRRPPRQGGGEAAPLRRRARGGVRRAPQPCPATTRSTAMLPTRTRPWRRRARQWPAATTTMRLMPAQPRLRAAARFAPRGPGLLRTSAARLAQPLACAGVVPPCQRLCCPILPCCHLPHPASRPATLMPPFARALPSLTPFPGPVRGTEARRAQGQAAQGGGRGHQCAGPRRRRGHPRAAPLQMVRARGRVGRLAARGVSGAGFALMLGQGRDPPAQVISCALQPAKASRLPRCP